MDRIISIIKDLCMFIGICALIGGFVCTIFVCTIFLCPTVIPVGIATLIGGFGIGYKVGKSDSQPAAQPAY